MTLADRIRQCLYGDNTVELEDLLKEVDLIESTYPDAIKVALERERYKRELAECLACKADLESELLCREKPNLRKL
jgi:hypothetical protein